MPRFAVVPWLLPEAYSGGMYAPVTDIGAVLARLPVRRVPIGFAAAARAENYGSDSGVPE
jgi:hypothetical protein